jgi:hypothetical protein
MTRSLVFELTFSLLSLITSETVAVDSPHIFATSLMVVMVFKRFNEMIAHPIDSVNRGDNVRGIVTGVSGSFWWFAFDQGEKGRIGHMRPISGLSDGLRLRMVLVPKGH